MKTLTASVAAAFLIVLVGPVQADTVRDEILSDAQFFDSSACQILNIDFNFPTRVVAHYPFSKGLAHWMDRHNAYSTFEAQQILDNRRGRQPFSLRKAFFASDFGERRYHQKELFYRLPARPLIKFLLLYGFKRGFLDGRAGFTYAMLQAMYEYLIVLKSRELEARLSADAT